MSKRLSRTASAGLLLTASLSSALPAGTAHAAAPLIERGETHEIFFDDFIHDVCGIDTFTRVDEHWTLKRFPDGSETLHTTRTFTPEDPRIPIEKGAATSFNAADGSRRVVGKPIQLFGVDGGVTLIDAGWISFDPAGDPVDSRGPHSFDPDDVAPYYCPA